MEYRKVNGRLVPMNNGIREAKDKWDSMSVSERKKILKATGSFPDDADLPASQLSGSTADVVFEYIATEL